MALILGRYKKEPSRILRWLGIYCLPFHLFNWLSLSWLILSFSAPLVLNSRLAPVLGLPLNLQAAAEAEKVLTQSLAMIESIWLEGKGRFLLGSLKPSIADLSLVCEIMQLEVNRIYLCYFILFNITILLKY